MTTYIRDGRSPIPKNELTSKVMSSNKAKNTKPELLLRKGLWREGIRGYRLHLKNIPGRPDIVFNKQKVAVFVNGCFWHRCPHCNLSLPKSNTAFWQNKFEKNILRDKEKINKLIDSNWQAITIWECEIKENLESCVNKIKRLIFQTNSRRNLIL